MNPHPASIPPEGRHLYAVRVYYEDTDAGGIVYHASYLRYAERARTEALRDLGIPHAELVQRCNLMFVVRRIEVDYLRPARVDDSLAVETEVLMAGAASATLRQTVRGAGGVCATLVVKLACVGLRTELGETGPEGTGPGGNKPGRLPPRWRTVLQAMRDARPADAASLVPPATVPHRVGPIGGSRGSSS
jgi:acyl-CoA thioester hydrolase